ncbi:MAG: FAD-dependent monooxygenase [Ktedonobacteraceae bacterium]|nr:FAD-dependent monooxygenase [Ktedonobacteraceae bacterium]
MQNSTKKALIIGCGIAGPAVALFLKQAGIEAEIYEARTTPEGYILSLASNGVAVLKMLGLDGATLEEGSPITRAIMWNGKGRRLAEMPLAGEGEQSVFIKRVPLGLILTDEAERQGIKIERGKKLERIEMTDENGVIATFQDGSTVRGDLLIGCDGVHSRTRKLIDPSFPGAVSTGLMNGGGYTLGLNLAPTSETIHFVFGKQAFFGYHVRSSGEVYWFVNYIQAEELAEGSLEGVAVEKRRQRLLDLFRDDQPFIRDIVRSAETVIPDFPTYILSKQPAWHRGPVVIVGDAAHAISASSGQGASMALEDAMVLAKCIRDIPEIGQAFETYEHLRRERTQKMLQLGLRGDAGKDASGSIQTWWRDQMTAFFLGIFGKQKFVDWIYSYKTDWDTPLIAHDFASTKR